MYKFLASKDLTQTLDQYPWYGQLGVGLALIGLGSAMIWGDKRMGGDDGFLWFAGFLVSIAGVFELWHAIF
jgi:hypothetical protein